jgi:hypothetical protein
MELKAWEGTKERNFQNRQSVIDFVYSSFIQEG